MMLTREQKIQRAEVARAWAEGRAVQYRQDGSYWMDVRAENDAIPAFFLGPLEWRIKPTPKVVPWAAETFPKDRPIYVRMKPEAGEAINFVMVEAFGEDNLHLASHGWVTWQELLDNYTQHDGKPCGVEVVE